MHKPKGRLIDVFGLPKDVTGNPRTVLMLDQLTHVPEAGDVLQVADRYLPIAQVDGRRIRNCLTGWKMAGRGSVAVLVNETVDALQPLARRFDSLFVTWLPKDELPWHFQTDDLPTFTRLNEDWNAHPNDVGLKIEQNGQTLLAHMRPNPYVYREYENVPALTVYFKGCERYRVTPVNDHGWYDGQCRFSGLAPSWGEFYEISGNTRDDMDPTPWITMEGSGTRHFHFYLRDEALEVKALEWALITKK
ncbi:hypothetical protein [Shimia thalassica]|uniref:hypothetical protein n=1 Tax=Shimia thalassica TaxID=1715693 RepID=UPI0026E1294C|nr:hypothetical protein [Shimia thalassica]MDO6800613.1 hypothetical protein [Shimia thalassica]